MLDNLLDCHIKYVGNLPETRLEHMQKLFAIIEIVHKLSKAR